MSMPILNDYDQFQGLHWETGSLRNFLAYRGISAPHTDQPFSEAMLLGISGGIAMGYFTFAYQGYDPQVQIITRNTFDPLKKIYKRLDIIRNVRQASNPGKGVINLVEVLQEGLPAIVIADMYSLPYNALPYDEGMWAMLPILVYGYDDSRDVVWIADRAKVPLTVTPDELANARARVKKTKFQIITFESPNPTRLQSAVQEGILECIQLFTEPPPKGSRNNFGFLAYKKWAELLVKPKTRGSWVIEFSAGGKMFAALTSAFNNISIFGKDGGADRDIYAQFLDEASILLETPELRNVAQLFRGSAKAWDNLGVKLLPDEVPLLKETRQFMQEKHQLFLNKGNASLPEIHHINDRLDEIKSQVNEEFPLSSSQEEELRENLRDEVLAIHDLEFKAIEALQVAIAE
jgi:hypothetical protein